MAAINVLALLLLVSSGLGQNATTAASPATAASAAQPSAATEDPEDILKAVEGSMLRRTAGAPSFHVKLALTVSGQSESGHSASNTPVTGTYEETWADPDHWKRSLTFGSTHTERVHVDGKDYSVVSGDPPFAPTAISRWVLPEPPDGPDLTMKEVEIGDRKLLRIGSGRVDTHTVILDRPAWYLDPVSHQLVAVTANRYLVSYTKLGKLTGKTVATAFSAKQSEREKLSATADIFEANITTSASDFAVPAGSTEVPATEPARLSSGVAAGLRIGGNPPRYPLEAVRNHVQGVVVIKATISKDGHVRDPQVVSTPSPLLAEAAQEAVQTYIYKPYLVEGVPVEVSTTINVAFHLE